MGHRSRRCRFSIFGLLLVAATAVALAQVGGVPKVINISDEAAGSPPSAGVLVNQTLYLAGQNGLNADGSVPGSFSQEARQAFGRVQQVLRAAGMRFGNAVWLNVYLTKAADLPAMNKVYWDLIGNHPPARTVLIVAALPNRENIEINGIAVSSAARRRVIRPQGWPHGPHIDPAGIQANDVLYMSSQGGVDPKTGKLAPDFAAEVTQALDNVATITKAAGMSMANVVWVNPYMSSTGAQGDVMNRIYKTYFQFGNTPGRGTIQVVALPGGKHIVFSCIAGADLARRKEIRPRNEKPSPTASPGILYDDTLYLSAKDAWVPALGLFSPELGVQTRLSMRNLLDGLQKANMDFTNVVSSTIYVRSIEDAGQVQDIYKSFFKGNPPARTTLQQNFDEKAQDVEQISFIAVRNPSH